jgi:hypothetical protein
MAKKTWGVVSRAVAALTVVASLVACGGSGGNNDQGIVFRATGIYRGLESIQPDRITCTEPTVSNAIIDTSFTLSLSLPIEGFPDRFNPFADPCGGYIGLQNNLSNQFMNVNEISLRYDVPGAAVQVPDHSVSFGQTIPPSSFDGDSPSGQGNLIYAELVGQIVPQTILVFLNQNVNRLPDTPYIMNVFLVARGQSDQGTNYQTNEIGYTITVVQ